MKILPIIPYLVMTILPSTLVYADSATPKTILFKVKVSLPDEFSKPIPSKTFRSISNLSLIGQSNGESNQATFLIHKIGLGSTGSYRLYINGTGMTPCASTSGQCLFLYDRNHPKYKVPMSVKFYPCGATSTYSNPSVTANDRVYFSIKNQRYSRYIPKTCHDDPAKLVFTLLKPSDKSYPDISLLQQNIRLQFTPNTL